MSKYQEIVDIEREVVRIERDIVRIERGVNKTWSVLAVDCEQYLSAIGKTVHLEIKSRVLTQVLIDALKQERRRLIKKRQRLINPWWAVFVSSSKRGER